MASFGELLRRRLAAGLTQEALAERAGISAKAVSDLERDPDRTPRLDSIGLLADALGLAAGDRAGLLAAARPLPPSEAALAGAPRRLRADADGRPGWPWRGGLHGGARPAGAPDATGHHRRGDGRADAISPMRCQRRYSHPFM
jgi:transcriptional regulator with XRE-family HTH domain